MSHPIILLIETLLIIILVTVSYNKGISPGNYMLYSWIGLPLFMFMIYGLAGADYLKSSKILLFLSEITLAWYIAQDYCFNIGEKLIFLLSFDNNIFRICLSIFMNFLLSIGLHFFVVKPGKKLFMCFSTKLFN